MNDIVNWFLVGGGSAVVGGAISWVIFLPYKRKNEELKNESEKLKNIDAAIDIWKDIVEGLRTDIINKDKKIDSLYDEIKEQRDEKTELYKEKENLVKEIMKLDVQKCDIKKCANRNPPSWY